MVIPKALKPLERFLYVAIPGVSNGALLYSTRDMGLVVYLYTDKARKLMAIAEIPKFSESLNVFFWEQRWNFDETTSMYHTNETSPKDKMRKGHPVTPSPFIPLPHHYVCYPTRALDKGILILWVCHPCYRFPRESSIFRPLVLASL